MLLVDDVQFLTNRKEMQAELLRLTEALLSAGHQIVLASDRPPNEIADLDERLISRFSGGLVVDMGPPDYETRVAILRRKAEERGVSFAPGVLDAAASLELSNVRELIIRGALGRYSGCVFQLRKNEKKLRTNLFAGVYGAAILEIAVVVGRGFRAAICPDNPCFAGGETNETLHMFCGGLVGRGAGYLVSSGPGVL